jgi:S-adenosylmethionine:tRNA-ribosyltransferase-isomerase (queuine synthetase)
MTHTPSAGFVLDWNVLASLKRQTVQFATITHAAGISSTGDGELDALLPFDEPYYIPLTTALAVRHAQLRGRRVIAVGTTVVRALEHWRRSGSAPTPHCAWLMQFYPARTNPVPAITICCAPSWTTQPFVA